MLNRYLTDTYMINPYLTDPCINAKLILTRCMQNVYKIQDVYKTYPHFYKLVYTFSTQN